MKEFMTLYTKHYDKAIKAEAIASRNTWSNYAVFNAAHEIYEKEMTKCHLILNLVSRKYPGHRNEFKHICEMCAE